LIDKGNYRHFMAKEIHEQPEVISHTLAHYVDFATGRVALPEFGLDPAKISDVVISACGTAYYAGLIGKYWLERYARIPVEIDIASEFRYREPPLRQMAWRCSLPNRVRPPIRWRPCATARRRVGRWRRSSTYAPPPLPANRTSCCRRWPVPKSASLQPRPSPAS
jgi:hypothetical protein